tara:strand:- start:102 stop:944 length:843 start_codon:yes stop_codon:yes gene_type:complete
MAPIIVPFNNGFGAEIKGILIKDGVDAKEYNTIHKAFLDHKVLVFRSQPLDDGAHLKFASLFGELDIHINKSTRHKALPKVQIFSNKDENGHPSGRHPEKGTLVWHTDKSYTSTPSLTTILRSPEIAKEGGNTLFSDMSRAYDKLPTSMKTQIRNLNAIHDWKRSREKSKERPATVEEIQSAPPVQHPIVRTHPETKKKSLYIGNHASHIVELPHSDGELLLGKLEEHATQPEYIYRHRWQIDDVLMWDNRCTMHCVEPYDASKEKRTVHRVVVKGDKPF